MQDSDWCVFEYQEGGFVSLVHLGPCSIQTTKAAIHEAAFMIASAILFTREAGKVDVYRSGCWTHAVVTEAPLTSL